MPGWSGIMADRRIGDVLVEQPGLGCRPALTLRSVLAGWSGLASRRALACWGSLRRRSVRGPCAGRRQSLLGGCHSLTELFELVGVEELARQRKDLRLFLLNVVLDVLCKNLDLGLELLGGLARRLEQLDQFLDERVLRVGFKDIDGVFALFGPLPEHRVEVLLFKVCVYGEGSLDLGREGVEPFVIGLTCRCLV